MMFDTGSSESWVISENCASADCLGHGRFKDTDSTVDSREPESITTVSDSNAFLEVSIDQFLSGSIKSTKAKDTRKLPFPCVNAFLVTIDGVKIPNVEFQVVSEMTVPVLSV